MATVQLVSHAPPCCSVCPALIAQVGRQNPLCPASCLKLSITSQHMGSLAVCTKG